MSPIHPQLHAALTGWLTERTDWHGAKDNPALFLNQRGQRLSVRGAHDIITAIAAAAGLDDDTTVHVLRHTFATTLVRGGTDLVIVAELLDLRVSTNSSPGSPGPGCRCR
jgi:site-specific recombinase XerD